MPILTPLQYVANRQGYDYTAPNTAVNILPTPGVAAHASVGIYPGIPPVGGISLRQFEAIMQAVYTDCANTPVAARTPNHINNLQAVSLALVHWKMASQGGRADRAMNNVLAKWNAATVIELLNAFNFHIALPAAPSVGLFQIDGVRIATASAFLRFLFSNQYGIVDSRVAGYQTNPTGNTNFALRPDDNYINDTQGNKQEFNQVYVPLLQAEAAWLNGQMVTFIDHDPIAVGPQHWRPCDVEMALW